MKRRKIILLFGLGIFLGLLALAGSTFQKAQAKSAFLHKTTRGENGFEGFPGLGLAESGWFAADGKFPGLTGAFSWPMQNPCAGLTPEKIRAGGLTILQCKLHCESILPAGSALNDRSDEELWACINGSDSQPPVEDVPIVPEDPVSPEPEAPVLPNNACADVTLFDFKIGSQESLECRLLCNDGQNHQSDEELRTCIEYYGGQPGDGPPEPPINPPGQDEPILPGAPPYSDQPGSLGPLATNPLIPLAGALIGTVVGWLTSVAVTSGNAIKTFISPPPKPGQPAAITPGPKPAVSPLAQTPAQPPAPIPAAGSANILTPDIPLDDPARIQPPVKPPAEPKSRLEHLWDIATNLVGSSATVTGSLSEFFDFQDDAQTVKKISDSFQAWKNNPTKTAAEAYYNNIRGMTRQNEVLAKAGKLLGNAANVLDGVDGVIKGIKKADERGYVGSDYGMTIAAEEGKKVLNFVLTKNPYFGLFNSALGGLTEMKYGKDGRVDVSAFIDKGADAWDNTTQEYAGYTGGDLFAPSNKEFVEQLAKDPELQRKDQYLQGIRRIKKLVEQGKITLQEGGLRIRRLRDSIL